MFWGLVLEPKKRYTQVVKHPFHISMAALDSFSADDEPTQVMLTSENINYLICTLQREQILQCSLDLKFETGDEVVFTTKGNSTVHLSGYLIDEFDMDDESPESTDEEAEVEEKPTNEKKRKVKNENQQPSKKSKLASLYADYGSDDDDDDDSFALVEEEDDDDDDLDASEEEDEEDEEYEDEDDNDNSDEDIQTPTKGGLNVNGISKDGKQNQKQKLTKAQKKVKKMEEQQKANDKSDNQVKPNEKSPKGTKKESDQKDLLQKQRLEGGLIIQDLKIGDGKLAKAGKVLQVYYEGRFKENNKVFDQHNKGNGFKFRLGKQEVIKGWDIGLTGMKIGGKRRVICPPHLGYGKKGSPPVIPPNSTLVFDVELKNVN